MGRIPATTCLCVTLAVATLSPSPLRAEDITIYRCTDARGTTTLRDTPCSSDQQQETRSMIRPRDTTRPAAQMPRDPEPPPAEPPVRTIVLAPPQPMYECRTPDGNTYTSDSPEGNPRWVPLWTLGFPVLTDRPVFRPGSTSIVRDSDGRVEVNVQSGGVSHGLAPTWAGYGGGTWVRDVCHMLPPAETCSRLRDRRREIGTRFFNAQPTERDQLRREQRGIDARLDNDCGGR